jgi:Tetratricopeptide repeat
MRAALARDDDYQAAGKPVCDWDDQAAREQLVDALFRDGYRALHALRRQPLGPKTDVIPARLSNLAVVLHDQGDLHGARTLHERALTIREARLGPTTPTPCGAGSGLRPW